jgi:hypothetical protein
MGVYRLNSSYLYDTMALCGPGGPHLPWQGICGGRVQGQGKSEIEVTGHGKTAAQRSQAIDHA